MSENTQTSTSTPLTCCGGTNGVHGLVHVRTGNGGGHNVPCPKTPPAVWPYLERESGRFVRTAVSHDGASWAIAEMPDGRWNAYADAVTLEETGVAALVNAPSEAEALLRVHRWS